MEGTGSSVMGHKINDELQPPHKTTSVFRLCRNGGGLQLYNTYKRCSITAAHGRARARTCVHNRTVNVLNGRFFISSVGCLRDSQSGG